MSRSPLRRLLWPAVSTVLMLLILLGLGTWQVHRLHWKERILAEIAHAEASPGVPLSGNPGPFTKVSVTGTFENSRAAFYLYGIDVRDTPQGTVMGAQLIVPLQRPDGPPVLIDRGWVPTDHPAPIQQPTAPVTVPGFVRTPDRPGLFSPDDDLAARHFYTLDPGKIGLALGLPSVAPFVLVVLGPVQQGVYPIPAQHLPRPPNNHLQYALTWYGLALVLVVVFVQWSIKAVRNVGNSARQRV